MTDILYGISSIFLLNCQTNINWLFISIQIYIVQFGTRNLKFRHENKQTKRAQERQNFSNCVDRKVGSVAAELSLVGHIGKNREEQFTNLLVSFFPLVLFLEYLIERLILSFSGIVSFVYFTG
jgi:hypothetical protein